ncbi:Ubiquitin fusion degradation protein-like protein [Hapsidospora chrysogenum ATCC 11550]|uniref:Ubiquitin fusion degradation protein-like protein n=1 Tax=Hapsidospora chrysogenum (strain ATCC 11550 / CBS 779.69 / DSM 880 / IAM 14645 / JCM 23072 / IMI 49137) TaxID=857340 RepID=A0A086T3Z5_HAPC1|nr:Ubiquitin fusion degradation protein-like protein [Hapsidospora chrysogenum ATCC 11550]
MDDEPAPLRWSGSFAVLPPSATSSKNLRGDKILLPQSALEQLLAASPTQPPSGATFTSYDPFNPYAFANGRATYRDQAQLPNPLMFRLVNPTNDNAVYAGIREFSAPEGSIGLSSFLLEALGIDAHTLPAPNGVGEDNPVDLTSDGDVPAAALQLTVHARQLPKGTYVRLRPLEAGYNPDDWKSLLERQLRESFTTLTRDAVLSVKGVQGETFNFLVDKLAPEGDGICVVDTDIEVDIEALNEEQARETLRQIMEKAQPGTAHGSSKGGELDIWKDVEGQVIPGEYVDYTLPSWNRSQPLEIVLSDLADDASLDLFVSPRSAKQRVLPRDTAHVFGNFNPAQHGSKTISIAPSNVELEEAESILISVHAYVRPVESSAPRTPIPFKLRARAAIGPELGPATANDDVRHSAEEDQCKNCFQWVPKRTMMLHENFCRRNNIVCTKCGTVFKTGSAEWESHWHCDLDDAHGNTSESKAKHDDVFHGNRQCPSCDFSTNSLPDLARHQTSVCPGKLILCRFCHLEVTQEGDPFNPSPEVVLSGMTAHELADGARTTECHLCDKIIRMRDMELHLKHHELDKANRAKPQICRNINCGRTLHGVGPKGQVGAGTAQGQGPGNELGLCSICFGPLYVSMYDPEGKALRRRIERRYLGQLMTGCGKSHCRNEWCKTGRATLGLEAKGASAQAALPMVKPLLAVIPDLEQPMYFCVDAANQTRRKVAEMMAAEKAWDLEWCVAAAEAEKGNTDRMRDWLQAWAPRR